ncbi:amidohydrolase family protein [Pseudomonas graminis]|nr:amidohydrolase family protein [Pseudomonas graminis]
MLDVFEKVNRDIPFNGIPWFFDHCETITPKNIERVKALGGGIAIQDRMAFQGEYFVERYGAKAGEHTPPIKRMLAEGVPVGAGTDATRVSSYNPWTSLYWMVSGRTVGGLALYPEGLSRETALELFTRGSAWFSSEQGKKGQIKVGQLADVVALSQDFFSVPEESIKWIESVLTIVDGKVVYGAGEFDDLAPPSVPVLPDWSPVSKVPGHWRQGAPMAAAVHQCSGPCGVHAHSHDKARQSKVPVSDFQGFWGAFGCSCFAF